jgi:hypothetical protein
MRWHAGLRMHRVRSDDHVRGGVMADEYPTALDLAEAGYRGYAEATDGKTFDGRDMPQWMDLPERTVAAWVAAAEAIHRAQSAPSVAERTTVHFAGGPWDGKTTDMDHLVAPVFGPGHAVGNHYWLDTKSSSGVPTYHWDGCEWATSEDGSIILIGTR